MTEEHLEQLTLFKMNNSVKETRVKSVARTMDHKSRVVLSWLLFVSHNLGTEVKAKQKKSVIVV